MVTLDRRKLTAPLLAQAGAFVVVLAIGVVTGHHGGGKPPNRPSTPATSPGGHVHTTPPGHPTTTPPVITSAADSTELSAVIDNVGSVGAVMPNLTVEVFKDNPARTLLFSTPLPGGIGGTPEVLGSVPARHDYEVCLDPPHDWTFTDQSTNARRGWDCEKVDARLAAQTVTFHLFPNSLPTGAVP